MDAHGNHATPQTTPEPSLIDVPETNSAEPSSAHDDSKGKQRRNKKCGWICHFVNSRQATNWFLVATNVLIAGLYAGLLIVGCRQTNLATEQNQIVKRQLESNESLVHKQLRAYLFASSASLDSKENGFEFVFNLVNAGDTAAHDFTHHRYHGFYTDKDAKDKFEKIKITDLTYDFGGLDIDTPEFVAKGSPLKIKTYAVSQLDLSEDALKKRDYKDESLWLIGLVGYRDIFGDQWAIRYRYRAFLPKDGKVDLTKPIQLQKYNLKYE